MRGSIQKKGKRWYAVVYDGVRLEVGFRLDMLVEDLVVVELKSVERMEPIFQAVLPVCLSRATR